MRTTPSLITLLSLVSMIVVEAAYAVDPSTMQVGPAIRPPQLQQMPGPGIKKDAAFMALPDNAVVQFQGKPTTKGALRILEAQARQAAEMKLKAAAVQAKAKFEARRAQFLQQQQAGLQAIHAKAQAEVARLRHVAATTPLTQQGAIRNEAIQLQQPQPIKPLPR